MVNKMLRNGVYVIHVMFINKFSYGALMKLKLHTFDSKNAHTWQIVVALGLLLLPSLVFI